MCVVSEPVQRLPAAASASRRLVSRPSAARIRRFAAGPPIEYWPIAPSLRTTRWHGTTSGTGLWASAVPTARTAFGRPISAAIQPYGLTSPRGISRAFIQTMTSKAVWPRRSRGMVFRRSPARRLPIAAARRAGTAGAASMGRPTCSRKRSSKAAGVAAVPTHDTPRPFQAT
jgi:hypothetical protein